MNNFLKNNINILILVVVILLVFYPLTLFIHPLKWDMIDCAMPWRFIVGESIHHGYLPMWNACQSLGYPIHADMQTIPWYLPAWILSGIIPFSLVALQLEFLFHVVMAGIGMFWLLRTLKLDSAGSLIFALSYALSGVIIGNAQHHNLIITAAWLPFLICSFYSLLKNPNTFRILVFSFYAWLLFTGGYLGQTFVVFYAIIGWFIFHHISHFNKNKKFDLAAFKSGTLALLIIVLLSLPQLVSILQSFPYVNRSNGIPLESAQYGAFTPNSFLSFIFPYATAKDTDWLRTDISMANIYIGICSLSLAILGLFHPGKKRWILLLIFISALLVSLGKYTPVREFLFNYVPMMNYSRFPAINRIFAVIPLILLAALGWKLLATDFGNYIRHLRWIILSLIITVLLIAIYFFNGTDFHLKYFISMSINDAYPFIDHKQQLIFQAIIQCILLSSLLIFSFVFSGSYSKWIRFFLIIVIIDLSLSANLNAPFTSYANDYSFSAIHNLKKHFEYGYNLDHNYSIAETDSICKSKFSPFLWRNMSNMNKHVSPAGFTSFYLRSYEYMLDTQKIYLDSLLKNKVAFITTDVRDDKEFINEMNSGNFNSRTVYIAAPADFDTNSFVHFNVQNIIIKPDEISVKVVNPFSSALLVLLQNHYKYWKVYVNDLEKPLLKISKTFMAVKIDHNTTQIVFRYKNPFVKYSFWMSILALIAVLTGLIYYRKS